MAFPDLKKVKNIDTKRYPRLVVMSDMHRGDGGGNDDFAHNALIYKCALDYYWERDFTYIELGDAEEFWEISSFDQIYITYTSIYRRLGQFHHRDPTRTRYLKVWGNHDLKWRDDTWVLSRLFPEIEIYEAVLVNKTLLLFHGHQADAACTGSWATFAKFFVRHFWPKLQKLGVKDPTRPANNPGLSNRLDDIYYAWAKTRYGGVSVIIAGHTHRPVYENLSLTERIYLKSELRSPGIQRKESDRCYYNVGSCVHPDCITAVELLTEGRDTYINLVKWGIEAGNSEGNGDKFSVLVKRTILESSEKPLLTTK